MRFRGRVLKFGDDIDTDVIIPARYLNSSDPEYLGEHCMEAIAPDFSKKITKGDIIVAGKNFGCGSSREHAPVAIKAAGISCVVAKSFARIFFRNAINTGLPLFEAPEVVDRVKEGDEIEIDAREGKIIIADEKFKIPQYPEFLQRIITAGGLMNYIKENRGF